MYCNRKTFDFDFFLNFDSISLPHPKESVLGKMCVCVCVYLYACVCVVVCVCVCVSTSPNVEPKPIDRSLQIRYSGFSCKYLEPSI